MRPPMGLVGNACDDDVVESFSTLERELLARGKFASKQRLA